MAHWIGTEGHHWCNCSYMPFLIMGARPHPDRDDGRRAAITYGDPLEDEEAEEWKTSGTPSKSGGTRATAWHLSSSPTSARRHPHRGWSSTERSTRPPSRFQLVCGGHLGDRWRAGVPAQDHWTGWGAPEEAEADDVQRKAPRARRPPGGPAGGLGRLVVPRLVRRQPTGATWSTPTPSTVGLMVLGSRQTGSSASRPWGLVGREHRAGDARGSRDPRGSMESGFPAASRWPTVLDLELTVAPP